MLASFVLVATVSNASAIIIHSEFIGGTAPSNVAGGGSFTDIFDVATDWWEAAIHDTHDVDIRFEWGPQDGGTLATVFPTGEALFPIGGGQARFDNDGSSIWYLDPAPRDSLEYLAFTEASEDLGGGRVNTGRSHTGATGDAAGRHDLLTIALHEIGHLMGVLDFVTLLPDPLVIGAGLPHPGTTIQTTFTGGGHIDPAVHPEAVMVPFFGRSERILISDIDILAAAQRSGFTDITLDPRLVRVPGPAPLALLVFGLLVIAVAMRWPRLRP